MARRKAPIRPLVAGGPIFRTWAEAIPDEGICAILGDRGFGKSAFAWKAADAMHEERPVVAVGMPILGRRLFPQWVRHVPTIEALRDFRDHVVIVDEMAIRAPARRSQSDDNLEFTKLAATIRQFHQLGFFISQHNRQVDVNIIGDASRIIFKKPSIMHIRFSRPEFRDEVQMAFDILSRKEHPRRWNVVFDYSSGGAGLLTNDLPSWWTEQHSEVYALALAGEFDVPDSRRRPPQRKTPRTPDLRAVS